MTWGELHMLSEPWFLHCKLEMLSHTSLGCMDFIRHQVILGPSKDSIWLSFHTWSCCHLYIWQNNGAELLCASLIYVCSVPSQIGHCWHCGKLKLNCRNSTCTGFRIVGHLQSCGINTCRGQAVPPSGQQRERWHALWPPCPGLRPAGVAVENRFWTLVTSQENFQVIHTALQSRPCRDLRRSGSRGARESLLSTENKRTTQKLWGVLFWDLTEDCSQEIASQ